MAKKVTVALLYGGKSPEHEISCISAKTISDGLNREKYDLVSLEISKEGRWPVDPFSLDVDVLFPILHGASGENGEMQGLFELMQIPYVGPSVLSASIGMNKTIQKKLWKEAGLKIAHFIEVPVSRAARLRFEEVKQELGLPFFVKPCSAGSSVGTQKVKSESDFAPAIEKAFSYDQTILIEEWIEGREFECALLGGADPIVSLPGEIIPKKAEFYTYEAKYLDSSLVDLIYPAKLTPEELTKIQSSARLAYQAASCEGMGRVDLFLTPQKEVVINEINTLPGFTPRSLYPLLWQASGLPLPELLDKLIISAQKRFAKRQSLKTEYSAV